MQGLGMKFDLGTCVAPVDLAGGAQTGMRLHLRNYDTVAVVFFKEAGAATEPTTLTLQEHSLSAAGTSQNLVVVDEYFLKSEATLDNDEVWTRVTQTKAATVVPAVSDTQQILVFEVESGALSAGFEWISVNTSDTATAGQLGGILYLMHGLKIQRRPDLLAEPLS